MREAESVKSPIVSAAGLLLIKVASLDRAVQVSAGTSTCSATGTASLCQFFP